MRVVWTQAALTGIDHAYDYVADFNPHAATRIAEGLRAAGDGLEHFPNRGRRVSGTRFRELINARSYVIRYQISDNDVIILRVRHTSRRPTAP